MAQDHAAAKRGGPQDGPLSGRQTGSQSDAGHGAAPDGPDVPGPAADNLPADNVPATDLPATDPPANDLPIESSIPVMLLRARERLMRDFRPLLAAEGFTEQQWRVMRTLAHDGPMDAAALSERSVILPPSLTRILQALEDRALLARRRDAADRRRILCLLTEAGEAKVADLAPRTAAVHDGIETRFGPERTAQLKALLREIARLD